MKLVFTNHKTLATSLFQPFNYFIQTRAKSSRYNNNKKKHNRNTFSAQHQKKNSTLNDVVFQLKELNKHFSGFSSNIAKSNEFEVVECVKNHLSNSKQSILEVSIGRKIHDNKLRTICEIDGLILTDDSLAHVIEVKSFVDYNDLKQLQNACCVIEERFGLAVKGYIGGPCFPSNVINEAKLMGFIVVEISGNRYRIIEDIKISNHGYQELSS